MSSRITHVPIICHKCRVDQKKKNACHQEQKRGMGHKRVYCGHSGRGGAGGHSIVAARAGAGVGGVASTEKTEENATRKGTNRNRAVTREMYTNNEKMIRRGSRVRNLGKNHSKMS